MLKHNIKFLAVAVQESECILVFHLPLLLLLILTRREHQAQDDVS